MHAIGFLGGFICAITLCASSIQAQAEMNGWGELRGIRVEGELTPITTSIALAEPGWKHAAQTAHWHTRNQTYEHTADGIVSTGEIALGAGPAVSFRQIVKNSGSGAVTIDITATAHGDIASEGLF